MLAKVRTTQERNGSNTPLVSYTRGTDLSGGFERAGAIGGLLAHSSGYSSGNWTNHNYYFADGNGNITYMLNSSQTMVASYRYDPFGNTISSSGTLASANVYRFSSKEFHANRGMYYYGFRFYEPNLQRWINRDLLGEAGFETARTHPSWPAGGEPNRFLFVHNAPLGLRDPYGLSACTDQCNKDFKDKWDKTKSMCKTFAMVGGAIGGGLGATGNPYPGKPWPIKYRIGPTVILGGFFGVVAGSIPLVLTPFDAAGWLACMAGCDSVEGPPYQGMSPWDVPIY